MSRLEGGPAADNDFYYFILNLNRGASQAEINERHRALSLIFHPDKQRDDNSREVATKKFLEIQKAYQILSDPFLREVYDILGERGLSIRWDPELRSKTPEDVKKMLLLTKQDMVYKDYEAKISASGTTICAIDATAVFEPYPDQKNSLARNGIRRLQDVRVLSLGSKYSAKKKLNDRTTVGFKTRVERLPRGYESSLMGTLRHQFSPRFTAEVDVGFLWPHALQLKGSYDENGNTVAINISSMLAALNKRTPSLNISVSRRLFRHRFETASFDLAVGGQPHFAINLTSPSVFGLRSLEQSEESLHHSPPSVSGLQIGTTQRKLGIAFDSILPTLVAEWSVNLAELALQLKLGIQYGLTGLAWVCAGTWSHSDTSVTFATILNLTGISIRIDLDHLHQRISLPVIVSLEPRIDLALWTVFIPSTALVVGYHFIIKPRRRKEHIKYIRAARKALEEDSVHRNDRETVIRLLNDSARKSKSAETSKGGLIITRATYGPQTKDPEASDLAIDVTIPLQALVRHSQLYISADYPKSAIQGFSDPAPSTPKKLSIRYIFAGHTHYAEIPEDIPVVLPLAEHLVK